MALWKAAPEEVRLEHSKTPYTAQFWANNYPTPTDISAMVPMSE